MRTLMFFSSLVLLALVGSAQQRTNTSTLLKNLEEPDSVTGARVVTVNHVMMDIVNPDTIIDGYRIRIFFDNSQRARQEFELSRELYDSIYPNEKVYVEYNAPYFKLTVGNFVNYEEAMIKWSRVVKDFKSAFIVPEKINVRELKSQPLIDTLMLDSLGIDTLSVPNLEGIKL